MPPGQTRARIHGRRPWRMPAICNRIGYMKRGTRFSVALHVLVHLAESRGVPATSEQLAGCVRTNPVVVRRTMGGLREAGLVRSARGRGGGWVLARDAASVTLRDVHAALGREPLIAIGKSEETPGCLIERAVAGALDDVCRDAEARLRERLGQITLADLADEVGLQTPRDGSTERNGLHAL